MFPDFLVVGAPKSATTSVHGYLRQHPGLFVPEVKEPHFFCGPGDGSPVEAIAALQPIARSFVLDPAAYRALFDGAGDRVTGECSTCYLADPDVPPRVVDANPEVRIVAIVRDPVDRAVSGWRMWWDLGVETLGFEAAIAESARRRADGWSFPLLHRELGLYAEQLARWQDFVDPDRILVLLFEEVRDDPASTCRKVFEFLGVDATVVPDVGQKRNLAEQRNTRTETRMLRIRHSRMGSAVAPVIPTTVRRRTRLRLRRRAQESTAAHVSTRYLDELRASFVDDIRELELRYGFDLDHWITGSPTSITT